MSAIKNNINSISKDTENLIKDYLRLLLLNQTQKLALVLGILTSVFIIASLLLIVVIFLSFTLAAYLNKILDSEYYGFAIVTGIYFFIILLIIVKLIRSKTPLFSNLFVKFIVFILDVEVKQTKNIVGLKMEKENVHLKIDADKVKVKAEIQMLRYSFMETIFKEFLGLFSSRKKKTHSSDEEKLDTDNTKTE